MGLVGERGRTWVACLLLTGCAGIGASSPEQESAFHHTAFDRTAVDLVLDGYHASAAAADGAAYFGAMTPDGVFVGTDATEHWTVDQFRAYAEPYFSAGRGWTYLPHDRRVAFSADGEVAWFEERLDQEKYGEMRGSGVLVLGDDGWRIAQYVLSFPVPNERTAAVLEAIRGG